VTENRLADLCRRSGAARQSPRRSGPIADASGNLFGTTEAGGANRAGTVFEIAKTATGYARRPTVLVSFCPQPNCTDGAEPEAGLLADAAGNLFGTTFFGGATGGLGSVFEIAKTATGYASAPTLLASFCARPNCADGRFPAASLIADAAGNLFGTTGEGGAKNDGTVFEVRGSGFVPPGTLVPPGTPNCRSNSLSARVGNYGGLGAGAVALGYSSVQVLQKAITTYCAE
jgi:uncharacterized repeat protein (TIGR03803 family)